MINAGATPKLITSVKESNSFPTFDVALINLAILPSKPSIIAAKIIPIIANSNLPSNANFIEVNPMHTPIKVNILGKITLAFFLSKTILRLFFGCCIFIFLPTMFHQKLFFGQFLLKDHSFHNKHQLYFQI